MDNKENEGINPISLEGFEVNTVKRPSAEDVEQEKDNYYVDPLEQDAIMKEKLARIEAERERRRQEVAKENEDEKEEEKPYFVNETIRPDMNVTGYFSNGNTAPKKNPLKKPASSAQINFCMTAGIINVAYALAYAITLIVKNFDTKIWFMNWVFIFLSFVSILVILNTIRILKVNKDAAKNKLIFTIALAGASLAPAIIWLVHWLIQIA